MGNPETKKFAEKFFARYFLLLKNILPKPSRAYSCFLMISKTRVLAKSAGSGEPVSPSMDALLYGP
jgi:hypothetical protein